METILENEYIGFIINSLAYLFCAFILFYIGRIVYQLFHKNIQVQHELVEKDNFSFSVAYVGYFIGLVLSIGSAVVGPSHGLLIDLMDIMIYGLLAIVLLNLSTIINDRFILRNFSVHKELIDDQNVGTGVIEAANSIASGLVIFGAVSGESAGLGFGLMTAVIFWLVGQVVMIITSMVYSKMVPYDVHDEIEKDNVAAGIGFAGAMIALANLVRFGLSGDFMGWMDTITDVGIEVLIGFALLPLVRLFSDKVLLPGRNLTDEIVNQEKPNSGAALIEAFSYIGGSVLITWCI